MKRNKTIRIAIVLLALVMVSTIGMATTLARYVDTLDGTAITVRAGRWNVVTTPGFAFAATMTHSNHDGTAAGTIQSHNTEVIIVPGTQVAFSAPTTGLNVDNNSEVPVDVALASINVPAPAGFAGIPLEFRLVTNDAATTTAWDTHAQLLLDITAFLAVPANTVLTTTPIAANTTNVNVPAANFPSVEVRWAFHQTPAQDVLDTAVGATQFTAPTTNTLSVTFNLRAQQAAA
ncbi:MAG: hypothetical protein FWD06_01975 [Oscillospiraceae bacterium]|nr:hypothetical protein [Oscillospiraceae bacterium]